MQLWINVIGVSVLVIVIGLAVVFGLMLRRHIIEWSVIDHAKWGCPCGHRWSRCLYKREGKNG